MNIFKNIFRKKEKRFGIHQIDFHYYWQLSDRLNYYKEIYKFDFIQIIDLSSSGDPKMMHRATILFKVPTTETKSDYEMSLLPM